jgi:hypothetical protein
VCERNPYRNICKTPGAAAEPQDCKIPDPAQARPFTPSTQPIQPRKPASTLTAAEVGKLVKMEESS